jgi:hypothetical protein
MKAISIHPEYCEEIVSGEKTKEFRSWNTKHRGDLLIVSTASKTYQGHAVCVAEFYGVKDYYEGEYGGDRCFGWMLRNIRPVVPFYIKGKQGFYEVDTTHMRFLSKISPESGNIAGRHGGAGTHQEKRCRYR